MFPIVLKYSIWFNEVMKSKYNSGFSSTEVLLILFFLSILMMSFSYFLNFQKLKIRKIKQEELYRKQIELCFNEYIEKINTNMSSICDGPKDNIYSTIPDIKHNCTIRVEPLSGKININALPYEFFTQTYFKSLLKENTDVSFIEELRKNGRYMISLNDVKDYVLDAQTLDYFSFLDFYNINTIDESVLQVLSNLYGCYGDIVSKKRILSVNKQYVKNETEADLYYGIDYSIIKPHLTVDSIFNINFMEEEFLKSLVNLKRFGIINGTQKVNELISLRTQETLDKESICNILGITANDELYYYLGCKTFFWDIIISSNNVSCKYRIFRDENQIYLINKRWY